MKNGISFYQLCYIIFNFIPIFLKYVHLQKKERGDRS